jgi:hypothetical protein
MDANFFLYLARVLYILFSIRLSCLDDSYTEKSENMHAETLCMPSLVCPCRSKQEPKCPSALPAHEVAFS